MLGATETASVTLERPAGPAEPSAGFRLASAVAEFGLLLHHSEHRGAAGYAAARERAEGVAPGYAGERVAELVELIGQAEALAAP